MHSTVDSLAGRDSHPGLEAARRWIGAGPKSLYINGKWVEPRAGGLLETINPTTEEVLAQIAAGEKDDIDAAVAAARAAFEKSSWSGMSPHLRSRLLSQIADKLERNADELIAMEALDAGMPIGFATGLMTMTVNILHYFAGWPSKVYGTTNPSDDSAFIYTLRQPLGVCGQITPWNVPMLQFAIKIAPALAFGNTVVLKPSELASLTTLRAMELLEEIDLPPGVLNVVSGTGIGAGAALAEHPDVDKIAFTGSTAVGRRILEASAGNFKHTTLELGGKSPNIIFPDADLDKAIPAAVNGFARNSGQVCSAGTRIFVHETICEEVTEKITRFVADHKVGDPFDPSAHYGPLISGRQLERVMSYIDAGNAQGASLETGGQRVEGKGYFVQPTVFSGVSNEMTIAREEIFGPVAAVIPFKDEDDVILQSNDNDYALSAGIWTRDVSRAHKMAKAVKAGRVWINTYGESDAVMPFGGVKKSGIGRELGLDSVSNYTEGKSVLLRFE